MRIENLDSKRNCRENSHCELHICIYSRIPKRKKIKFKMGLYRTRPQFAALV